FNSRSFQVSGAGISAAAPVATPLRRAPPRARNLSGAVAASPGNLAARSRAAAPLSAAPSSTVMMSRPMIAPDPHFTVRSLIALLLPSLHDGSRSPAPGHRPEGARNDVEFAVPDNGRGCGRPAGCHHWLRRSRARDGEWGTSGRRGDTRP